MVKLCETSGCRAVIDSRISLEGTRGEPGELAWCSACRQRVLLVAEPGGRVVVAAHRDSRGGGGPAQAA